MPALPAHLLPTRRQALAALAALPLAASGCRPAAKVAAEPEKIYGGRGYGPGKFQKPRAIAIDAEDRVYVCDMTARIQVFDREGNYLSHWQTPASENGRPVGMAFDRAGRLRVADTHYFRVLAYTPEGRLLEELTIGSGYGHGPGQFGFVTDCAQDSQGCFYASEYGEYDRIQKFSPDGEYLFEWGSHGSEPGQFLRPAKLEIDEHDHLWVADACNHRVQVFDATGSKARFVQAWGEQGHDPGQLRYPYDIVLAEGHVYLAEFGNHRVQKLTRSGDFVASWGANGRHRGQLDQPWGVARDSTGSFHVLDSYNHRVQRFRI